MSFMVTVTFSNSSSLIPLRAFCAFGRTAQALYTSYTRLRAFTRLVGFFCAPRRVGFVHLHRCAVLILAASA